MLWQIMITDCIVDAVAGQLAAMQCITGSIPANCCFGTGCLVHAQGKILVWGKIKKREYRTFFLQVLTMYNRLDAIDVEGVVKFVASLQQPDGSFYGIDIFSLFKY